LAGLEIKSIQGALSVNLTQMKTGLNKVEEVLEQVKIEQNGLKQEMNKGQEEIRRELSELPTLLTSASTRLKAFKVI
jgi:uncharacterized protein (DUF3084 family)